MDILLMFCHHFLLSSLLRCGLLLGLAAQGATALKALPSNDSGEDAPPLPRQKKHHDHTGKESTAPIVDALIPSMITTEDRMLAKPCMKRYFQFYMNPAFYQLLDEHGRSLNTYIFGTCHPLTMEILPLHTQKMIRAIASQDKAHFVGEITKEECMRPAPPLKVTHPWDWSSSINQCLDSLPGKLINIPPEQYMEISPGQVVGTFSEGYVRTFPGPYRKLSSGRYVEILPAPYPATPPGQPYVISSGSYLHIASFSGNYLSSNFPEEYVEVHPKGDVSQIKAFNKEVLKNLLEKAYSSWADTYLPDNIKKEVKKNALAQVNLNEIPPSFVQFVMFALKESQKGHLNLDAEIEALFPQKHRTSLETNKERYDFLLSQCNEPNPLNPYDFFKLLKTIQDDYESFISNTHKKVGTKKPLELLEINRCELEYLLGNELFMQDSCALSLRNNHWFPTYFVHLLNERLYSKPSGDAGSHPPVLITYGAAHHGGETGIITQIRHNYPQIQMRKLQQDGTFSPCKDD
ncbi:hypothetical protein [Candidatus Hepatobacter penaei]|uniref:hypothetical protein n=1 Tax=Candidatus Hepatobacter penaei TaxID=1274402 RepID=UPI0004F39B12|nr:hypothetical protein [Candidatus Hepatobacter penaei]